MKVALLLLPSWSIYNLPLGIATVASIFRYYGHDVKTFDLNLEAIQIYRKKYNNL